jgi:putative endonuclease
MLLRATRTINPVILTLNAAKGEGPMHFRERRSYSIYILTNHSKTLYVGMTNNLSRRVWEHKQGTGSEFCKRYKIDRLVYYESFDDVIRAINREKQIKGLLRIKKIQMIVSVNPTWRDLSDGWYERHLYQPDQCMGPSLRSG